MTNSLFADCKDTKAIVHVAGAMEFIKDVLKDCEDKPEYRRPLKTAHTNLQKVLDLRFSFMDIKGLEVIRKRLDCDFKIVSYNGKYNDKGVATCTVGEQSMYELCEIVTSEKCYDCKVKNHKNCRYRKMLRDLCCPAVDPDAKHGCEYRIDTIEEQAKGKVKVK